MCPIFQISNVTGDNMDLLKMFLNLLSSRTSYRDDQPAEFQIDDTYSVPVSGVELSALSPHPVEDQTSEPFVFLPQGVGTVVSGTTLRGLIRLNDTMLLGPDPLGSFIPIAVKSIHRKRMPVKEVRGGQTASFALKKVGGGKSHHKGVRRDVLFCHICVPCIIDTLSLFLLRLNLQLRKDQALVHKERHGDGVAKAEPTGHLGV